MDARSELVWTVAFALRHKALYAKWRNDAEVRQVAEAIVAHLELYRYRITRDTGPPSPSYFPDVRKG